jgi:tetratricopeptide (TPR) repeat protein
VRKRISFVLLAFAVVFITLEVSSFRQKSATWDEPIHLTAGYVALAEADYRVDPTHPPFIRIWAALPLLALRGVGADTTEIDRTPISEWLTGAYAFAHQFLYRDHDADQLLYAARFMVVLWGVVLGILIFCWAHEWLGFVPAVAALTFYTLEPNIAAHARLVTTDLGATCFIFGAVYCLWRTCRRPGGWNVFGLAICVALAVITKFSGVLLGPIIIVLLAAAVMLRTRISATASIGILVCLAATTYVVVWAAYGFRYAPSASETWLLQVHESPVLRDRMPLLTDVAAWADKHRLLPNVFVQGFLLSQASSQSLAYLAGNYSEQGFWYYFPVAFLLKTPSSLILLFLTGIVLFVARRRQLGLANEAFVLLPVVVYLGFAMASGVNMGLRHILPVYPFVLLISASAAKALAAWKRPIGHFVLASVMVFWFVMFVRVYPHTLTFFNVFAGGPQNGLMYLADSNLDWGQDLKLLKAWMERKNHAHVNLAYFGTADPEYYEINCTHLPGAPFFASDLVAKPRLPGFVAISVTVLSGVHLPPMWRLFYSGFLNEQPVAQIGNSIRVYWVESWPDANYDSGTVLGQPDSDVQASLGDMLLFGLKWPDAAVAHYRASLSGRPDHSATVGNLGVALSQAGKAEEGLRMLQRAAVLDPENGETRTRLAAALLLSRKLEEAETHAQVAARLSPDDPLAHDLLGVALTGIGKLDAAVTSFKRALEIAPDYELARKHLQLLESGP